METEGKNPSKRNMSSRFKAGASRVLVSVREFILGGGVQMPRILEESIDLNPVFDEPENLYLPEIDEDDLLVGQREGLFGREDEEAEEQNTEASQNPAPNVGVEPDAGQPENLPKVVKVQQNATDKEPDSESPKEDEKIDIEAFKSKNNSGVKEKSHSQLPEKGKKGKTRVDTDNPKHNSNSNSKLRRRR